MFVFCKIMLARWVAHKSFAAYNGIQMGLNSHPASTVIQSVFEEHKLSIAQSPYILLLSIGLRSNNSNLIWRQQYYSLCLRRTTCPSLESPTWFHCAYGFCQIVGVLSMTVEFFGNWWWQSNPLATGGGKQICCWLVVAIKSVAGWWWHSWSALAVLNFCLKRQCQFYRN